MNTLDILKEDIKDRNRSIERIKHNLHGELKYLEENLFELNNDSILNYIGRFEVKINHIIEHSVMVWVLEKYYALLKEEQDNNDDFDFMEEFEKWETEHTPNEKYKK